MKFRQLHSDGGDCTAPYEVTDFKAKTVGEFVNEVVASRPKEWGTIFEIYDGTSFHLKICEYKYGKVLGKIDEGLRDREIEPTVFASGGWTRMDYKLKLKETMETMEKSVEEHKPSPYTDSKVIDWEQRRFELVKAIFPQAASFVKEALLSGNRIKNGEGKTPMQVVAEVSTNYADALIERLKGGEQ